MPTIFDFSNIVTGQQLQIYFKNNETIIHKSENSAQGTRFVVFGETAEGEKVLIPAFTSAELDSKYGQQHAVWQDHSNCTIWNSKTKFNFITPRFIDVEEIYLWNREGKIRKYDSAFQAEICLQKSNFYDSKQATYNFNELKLLTLKAKVRTLLLEHQQGSLPITESVSLLQQALTGVIPFSAQLLTMKEKVTAFIAAISQLTEPINLFVYHQPLAAEQQLEINDVISQVELLHKLNVKTGFLFTKEELTSLQVGLEVVDNSSKSDLLTVTLNLTYKDNDDNWSGPVISSPLPIKNKVKNKVSLLFNLHAGFLTMNAYLRLLNMHDEKDKAVTFFQHLDTEIKKLKAESKAFIKLSEEDKSTVLALLATQQQWEKNISEWKNKKGLSAAERLMRITKDEASLAMITAKIEKMLTNNEVAKQKALHSLLIKMKLVNNLQMVSYLEKSLFLKSKDYLIACSVFKEGHNFPGHLFSPEAIKQYAECYDYAFSNGDRAIDADRFPSFAKIDNLLNDNFATLIEIYQLLPIEFQSKPIYIVLKLLKFFENFKQIEMNKLSATPMMVAIVQEEMMEDYISCFNYPDYEGMFAPFIKQVKNLEMQLANCARNSEQFKTYQQQLKTIKVQFWKAQDFNTLINEIINVYFPNEKQEILPKFSLEEHFLLEEQILANTVLEADIEADKANLTKLKLTKATNILASNHKLAQGFQTELAIAFKVAAQMTKVKLNEQRITTGQWEVNDIIAVNSINNVAGIRQNNLVYFQVLQKNKANFTVIIKYLNAKKTWEYKIRDITINNCGSFVFKFPKAEITFLNQQEIWQTQALINDYIIDKDETITNLITLLTAKLKAISNPILKFVKVNNHNYFNDWEWKINLQKIKEKLLLIIAAEIKKYSDLLAAGQVIYQTDLANHLALQNAIVSGDLTFAITKASSEHIQNLSENINQVAVALAINYQTSFWQNSNYQAQITDINFQIMRDSAMAREWLANIQKEVTVIKDAVTTVNTKLLTVVDNLTKLHSDMAKFLQVKKNEWRILSNHTNLHVQLQNQQILAKLKVEIETLNQSVNNVNNKISVLYNEMIETSHFADKYLLFINHYEGVSGLSDLDLKKYLSWEKNYDFIKQKLAENTGYQNFIDYKNENLNKINEMDTYLQANRKALVNIAKIKFKKLNWWQKIINKLSWTWAKTKIAITKIKSSNKKNFEFLTSTAQFNEVKARVIKKILQQQNNKKVVLPTAEPWDEWMLVTQLKVENVNNLHRQNSSDSGISLSDYEQITSDDDLANSDEISQEVSYGLSRSSSTDSGIANSGELSPKLVAKNCASQQLAADVKDYCEQCNVFADSEPLVSPPTAKLSFS